MDGYVQVPASCFSDGPATRKSGSVPLTEAEWARFKGKGAYRWYLLRKWIVPELIFAFIAGLGMGLMLA